LNACWFVQVLIRLIGADETMYSSYADSMQWLDDIKVLEMIVDKFSTSVRTKDYF
jgi:serine/threonine-protein phosphatase 6 regulatory subunit 3